MQNLQQGSEIKEQDKKKNGTREGWGLGDSIVLLFMIIFSV